MSPKLVNYSSPILICSSLLDRRSFIDNVADYEPHNTDEVVNDDVRTSVDGIQSRSSLRQRQRGDAAKVEDEENDIELVKLDMKRGEIMVCDRKKVPGKQQCRWKTIPDKF